MSVSGALLSCLAFSTEEDASLQFYSIPEGKAHKTLKMVALQSKVDLVAMRKMTRGVSTPPLEGHFEVKEAFARLLEGSPIEVVYQSEINAYTVVERPHESSVSEPSNEQTNTETNQDMIELRRLFKQLSLSAAAAGIASSPQINAQDDSEDEVFELSPFTVDASEESGYVATTTLAGTRLKTNLRDVGAAVSVMTAEMFEDTGATDAQTILSYGLGTEVAGVHGNFVGGSDIVGGQQADEEATRVNPQQSQRVRGLARAQLTRSYFETDIGFDSYNTERITINRGPNSLLFGIGSAGGVIDNSLAQASLGSDFGEFSVRIGERSSHRETLDYNKVLVDGRLAVRVAAMYENTEFKQRPAYEEENRFYVALNAVLLENENSDFFDATTLRVNFEDGSATANPPVVTPPGDSISSWFSLPSTATQAASGSTLPSWMSDGTFVPKFTVDSRGLDENGVARGITEGDIKGATSAPYFIQLALHYPDHTSGGGPSIQGTQYAGGVGRTLYHIASGGERGRWDYQVTSSYFHEPYFAGFRTPSIPTHVLDNRNLLISGDSGRVERDFDASNFVLEQTLLGGRAGIEIAFDKQTYETWRNLPFESGGGSQIGRGDIFVDVQERLSNDIPNPNLGRLMMVADSRDSGGNPAGFREDKVERESTRATAFYDLDFTENDGWSRWLGRHVITGVLSTQERDSLTKNYGAYWESANGEIDLTSNEYHFGGVNGVNQFRLQSVTQVYIGDSLLDPSIQSFDDIRITQPINVDLPDAGDTYYMFTYDRINGEHYEGNFTLRNNLQDRTEGTDRNLREIDTEVLSIQSYLFGGDIVGLLGWRTDEQTSTPSVGLTNFTRLPNGDNDGATNLQLGDALEPESGNTFTWSVVAHLPQRFELPGGIDLSAHYNSSENFNPVGARSSLLGEALPSPSGLTEEYGFTVGALEGKFSARFNWYKTSIDHDTADLSGDAANPINTIHNMLDRWGKTLQSGWTVDEALAVTGPEAVGLYSSHDQVINEIISFVPPEYQAVYNLRLDEFFDADYDLEFLNNPTPTRSFKSEGFEMDVVGNLTQNWRVFMNAAKQETVESNIGREQLELSNYIGEQVRASPLRNIINDPILDDGVTHETKYVNSLAVPLLAGTLKEGTTSLELREWRVNLGTNYSFTEGRFKGVGIGGAVRWQSEAALGYPNELNENGVPVPILSQPFFGPEEFNGDIWLSYGKKIRDGKIDWKAQINFRNAFGDNENIPVTVNPDGQVAIFRNPLPREVFLTNTFRF